MIGSTQGWIAIVCLALGVGFLAGAWLLYWHGRRQMVASLRYILDRIKLTESDVRRMVENEYVLKELLKSRGHFDDEDLTQLRRELIELPRQIEAERAELLKQAVDDEVAEKLVNDFPDTLH